MPVTLQEARPPYVRFERKAVEDREASMRAGSYRAKDVDFALITPAGSKDRIERRVDEWLQQLDQQVREERLPPEWFRHYKEQYKAFQEGSVAPLSGTAILEWPVISPAQRNLLITLNILTVEDLAALTSEARQAIGMGAVALQEKAQAWLTAADKGKATEQLAALMAENGNLKVQLEAQSGQMKALLERIEKLETE